MRKHTVMLVMAFVAMLVMAFPAAAVELHTPHQGTTCDEGEFTRLHFVLNQYQSNTGATITVEFADGTIIVQQSTEINRRMQHFRIAVTGESELVSASTNTGDLGRLVLSDYECDGKK